MVNSIFSAILIQKIWSDQMRPAGRITVPTVIPQRLSRLKDIANNLWWTWNCEAAEMFKMADASLWEATGGNPAAIIKKIGSKRLEQLLNDEDFLSIYDDVVSKFDAYMNRPDTWFSRTYPDLDGHMVAYFSAEYGLSETLPIYSGGLAFCRRPLQIGQRPGHTVHGSRAVLQAGLFQPEDKSRGHRRPASASST